MNNKSFQWGGGKSADAIRKFTSKELAVFVSEMLSSRESTDGVWVFGYGSLMWNPDFKVSASLTGTITGYKRCLCLKSMVYRGTPDYYGLVFGLDVGESCQGMVFKIDEKDMQSELQKVWEREMFAGTYKPTWVDVDTEQGTISAITFVINQEHEHYVPYLKTNELAERVFRASGDCGTCKNYVQNTMEKLNQLGLSDPSLEQLIQSFESSNRVT